MMKKLSLASIVFLATCSLWAQSPCDTLPDIDIIVTDSTPCFGDEITLTASGGQTYSWNNGISNGVGFTPAASDTFSVIVTDTNGCIDTASIAIEVLPLPNVIANSSSLNICLGDSVRLNAINASTYNWITPAISNNSYYTPLAAGTDIFTVEGTGANGCVNTSQVIVVVNDIPPIPTLSKDSISTCLNVDFNESIKGTAQKGRVIWFSDQDLTQIHGEQDVLPTNNSVVGVQTYWATSFDAGCYSEGVEAKVEVFALPEVNAGEDVSVNAGDRGTIQATTNVPVTATWSPQVNLDDPFSLSTDFVALEKTTYTLEVIDENNCVSRDQLFFDVHSDLKISNVMTPNEDGDNDVWKIYPESTLATCRVRLYDGFGRTMIYEDGYLNNWGGTYEGEPVPDGDYYYHITCTGGFSKKGTLTILR